MCLNQQSLPRTERPAAPGEGKGPSGVFCDLLGIDGAKRMAVCRSRVHDADSLSLFNNSLSDRLRYVSPLFSPKCCLGSYY